MLTLKKLAYFPDDYSREDLAEILRKPVNEIEPDALRLAADIIEGKIKFQPTPKIQNKKNALARDRHIHELMSYFTGLGLAAWNEDKNGFENKCGTKLVDASFMVAHLLREQPWRRYGARTVKRDEVRKIFRRLGGDPSVDNGSNLITKCFSLEYKDEGCKVLEFNNGKVPQTLEEVLSLIERWENIN